MARPATTRQPALAVGGLALAAEAARRFHLDGDSKVQIAADLGVSRFKVARLLDAARAAGVVQIRIGSPPQVDAALSQALRERLGLRQAVVLTGAPEEARAAGGVGGDVADAAGGDVDGGEDTEAGALGAAVGRLAAGYVQELVSAEDVVGLAWGHALSALSASWTAHVPATFVQLAGALARPDTPLDAPGLVRSTAAAAGGTAAWYYAPLVMPDAASAAALRQQVGLREALGRLDEMTRAVISIGAWAPGESTVHDGLEPADQRRVRASGVVAETTGLLLTADGRVVDALGGRVVAVSEAQLRRTPHVVALAVGDSRAEALVAVVRSGLVTTLITHASLARAVLAA